MTRCRWLMSILLLLSLGSPSLFAAELQRPNILLIMADDLGFESLRCYGGESYHTPHLDQLAREGLRFETCYATPLCSPSRVELMSGRYGFRTGWIHMIDGRPKQSPHLDPAITTFAQRLSRGGYSTAIAGKWQLAMFDQRPDHPQACGFEQSCLWSWILKGKATSRYWEPSIFQNGKPLPTTNAQFGEDLFTNFLIDFIKTHRDRPFLAYYPMTLVHDPLPDCPPLIEQSSSTGSTRTHLPDKHRFDPQRFAAMLTYMDHCVGKLLATLDEAGLRERTLVIFAGDNGTHHDVASRWKGRSIHGGKGTMTQLGTRVPLIMQWKGVTPPGKVSHELVDFTDICPTLLELSGMPLPTDQALDGKSLVPLIKGAETPHRDWVFTQLGEERFVRNRRWALHADGRIYDLQHDELGEHPVVVAGNPDATAAKAQLERLLGSLRPADGKYPPATLRQNRTVRQLQPAGN